MIREIHVGDVGTVFRITVRDEDDTIIDVSSATTLQLIFKKPSGDLLTKNASLYTDGTNGIIEWITTSIDDLDESGIWKLQTKIILGSSIHHSDISTFDVFPNLD